MHHFKLCSDICWDLLLILFHKPKYVVMLLDERFVKSVFTSRGGGRRFFSVV